MSRTHSNSLLRYHSRGLAVTTHVEMDGGDTFVVLRCGSTEVGRRRLNKGGCCHSESPCIGPILISKADRLKFSLPPFVYVSTCFDEIESQKPPH